MKFRKKPIVIEAVQLLQTQLETVFKFIGESRNFPECKVGGIDPSDGKFKIRTLEGVMIAEVGDWIIRGIKGEYYPCKPDIFEGSYENADQLQPFGAGKATNEPVSFENRLNQYEAILGFVSFLTTKTSWIVLASGHNPGNVNDLIVSFCIANNFPKPKAGWEKMLRFPE